jgi:hypothetical protein
MIVIDALSRMLSRTMVGVYLAGFQVDIRNSAPLEISQLFANDTLIMCDADHDQIHNLGYILLCFEAISGLKVNANDTLIMCDADRDQIHNLGDILLCFEASSGLKVNLEKSKLLALHQEELVDLLSCSISSLLMKYLGIPLGATFKLKAIWERVVQKVEKRLASWKKIYLLRGGHLILIKSTLSKLPM